MEAITNKQQVFKVFFKDGSSVNIHAAYFLRSADFFSWEFYDVFPLSAKAMPICAIRAACVERVLMDGFFSEEKKPTRKKPAKKKKRKVVEHVQE